MKKLPASIKACGPLDEDVFLHLLRLLVAPGDDQFVVDKANRADGKAQKQHGDQELLGAEP